MSTVRDRVTLRPGARAEDAPLVGLETYDAALAVELLQSLRAGDAEEQRATLEFLMQALDEGRPEGQKLFPIS
jgi:hypothetical protein